MVQSAVRRFMRRGCSTGKLLANARTVQSLELIIFRISQRRDTSLNPAKKDIVLRVVGFTLSPEPLEHKVDKYAEDQHASPEDPLVLFRSPFHHSDSVSRNAHGRANRVQLPLCSLQHLSLIAQIPEHSPSSLKILVERRVRRTKEILLPQRMILPRLVRTQSIRRLVRRIAIHTALPGNKVWIRCSEQRIRASCSSACSNRSIRVWVLRRLARVRPPAQQF